MKPKQLITLILFSLLLTSCSNYHNDYDAFDSLARAHIKANSLKAEESKVSNINTKGYQVGELVIVGDSGKLTRATPYNLYDGIIQLHKEIELLNNQIVLRDTIISTQRDAIALLCLMNSLPVNK